MALYGINQQRYNLQNRIVELRKEVITLNGELDSLERHSLGLIEKIKVRARIKAAETAIADNEVLLGKLETERKEILQLIAMKRHS